MVSFTSFRVARRPERLRIDPQKPTYPHVSAGLVFCPGPSEAINAPKGLESIFYSIFQRLKIRMRYVESEQIASLSCWLAAAALTHGFSKTHSGLLRPECQAGFPISSEEFLLSTTLN